MGSCLGNVGCIFGLGFVLGDFGGICSGGFIVDWGMVDLLFGYCNSWGCIDYVIVCYLYCGVLWWEIIVVDGERWWNGLVWLNVGCIGEFCSIGGGLNFIVMVGKGYF